MLRVGLKIVLKHNKIIVNCFIVNLGCFFMEFNNQIKTITTEKIKDCIKVLMIE